MKGSFCYLPILKARGGVFDAVRTVSPKARARIAPLFDVLPPNARQGKDPQAYLMKKEVVPLSRTAFRGFLSGSPAG